MAQWRPVTKETVMRMGATDSWYCQDNSIEGQNCCHEPEMTDLVHTTRKVKRKISGQKRKKIEQEELDDIGSEEDEDVTATQPSEPSSVVSSQVTSMVTSEGMKGTSLLGHRCKLFWDVPGGAQSYYASIEDYDQEKCEYKLMFDNGTVAWGPTETFVLVEKTKTSKNKKKREKPPKKKRKLKKYYQDDDSDGDFKDVVVYKQDKIIDFKRSTNSEDKQRSLNLACQAIELFLEKLKPFRSVNGQVDFDKIQSLNLEELVNNITTELSVLVK